MPAALLIAAYYFAFFGALGIFLPFFTLVLAGRGLSATEATRLVSALPLMALIAPPLFGLVADAQRARGWLLRGASVAMALAFAGLLRVDDRPALYLITAAFAFARAPLTALIDATTLETVHRHGGSYGRLRLWGSLGFLVAAVGGGVVAEASGVDPLLALATGLLTLCALLAFALPAPPPRAHDMQGALRTLLNDEELPLFLGAVTMAQLATSAYDSAFTLHLARLGLHGRFVGVAWATGVAAEIIVMALSPRLLARIAAPRLFAFAIAVAAARWLCLSRVTSPAAILLLQPLHGITFGLFWVAAITIVRDRGRAAPTTAQGLLSAVMGIGGLVGMNVSGRLLDNGGGRLLYGAAGAAALAGFVLAAAFSRRCALQASQASPRAMLG
jgi:PPP family 3-phenylpropionic acid transporter